MASKTLTEDFETRVVVIRGTTYRFRELTAAEYNAIIKLATGPDDNADLNTVLTLMTVKALIDPKLTNAELEGKTYPVYAKLLQTVNAMHFTPLEDGVEPAEEGELPNA